MTRLFAVHKKVLYVLIIIVIFVSCAKNKRTIIDTNVDSSESATNYSENSSEVKYDFKPVMKSVETENINEILAATDNFIPASDGIKFYIPDSCNEVYTFEKHINYTETGGKYKESFTDAYKEIFSGNEYNEEKLYLIGRRFYDNREQWENKFPRYIDYKDSVDSGEENVHYFYYENLTPEEYSFLESGGYLGSWLFSFNRAKLLKKKNEILSEKIPVGLEVNSPNLFSEYVKCCNPDSTESFKLMDKDVRVCDAVAFFEKYIENLSFLKNDHIKPKVVNVEVFRFSYDPDEYEEPPSSEKYESYSFLFSYTFEYRGLLFSGGGTVDARNIEKCEQLGLGSGIGVSAFGAMVNSYEVDYLYETQYLFDVQKVVSYDKIISLENVVKICSEKVTPNVEFSVIDLGLFYMQSDVYTGKNVEDQYYMVTPVWCITLLNNNDEKYYRCTVDAITGKFLSIEGFKYVF